MSPSKYVNMAINESYLSFNDTLKSKLNKLRDPNIKIPQTKLWAFMQNVYIY